MQDGGVSTEDMSDAETKAAAGEPSDSAPISKPSELNRLEKSLEFKTPCGIGFRWDAEVSANTGFADNWR